MLRNILHNKKKLLFMQQISLAVRAEMRIFWWRLIASFYATNQPDCQSTNANILVAASRFFLRNKSACLLEHKFKYAGGSQQLPFTQRISLAVRTEMRLFWWRLVASFYATNQPGCQNRNTNIAVWDISEHLKYSIHNFQTHLLYDRHFI